MILPILFLLFTSTLTASVSMAPEKSRVTRQFVSGFSKQSGIPEVWLNQQFESLELNDKVLTLIQKPYEDKIWGDYEKLFITSKRVDGGKKFLKDHAVFLQHAERVYGVPKSVITSIIGVETSYGQNMGNINTLEALATLSFYYAPRYSFFEDEMKALLKIAYERKWNLQEVEGSYAGAIGMPQFMPSNVIRYAVSNDKKSSKLDLFHHPKDAMLSVANYLSKHGKWQAHEPIVLPIKHLTDKQISLLNKQFENKNILVLDEKLQQLVPPLDSLPGKTKPGWLIRLRYKDHQDFYFAYNNFKSIMSYNNSTNYAFAVTYLAAAINDNTNQLSTN